MWSSASRECGRRKCSLCGHQEAKETKELGSQFPPGSPALNNLTSSLLVSRRSNTCQQYCRLIAKSQTQKPLGDILGPNYMEMKNVHPPQICTGTLQLKDASVSEWFNFQTEVLSEILALFINSASDDKHDYVIFPRITKQIHELRYHCIPILSEASCKTVKSAKNPNVTQVMKWWIKCGTYKQREKETESWYRKSNPKHA